MADQLERLARMQQQFISYSRPSFQEELFELIDRWRSAQITVESGIPITPLSSFSPNIGTLHE
jgi:hypothetical protein